MTFSKRQKEKNRQDRQREKEMKRQQRRDRPLKPTPDDAGVDPDIAGIIPGPQPPPDDL
jgi:hypothetical protein